MLPKQLTLALRYLRHRAQKIRPYEVQASITNRCNLHCVYCSCGALTDRELTTEVWKEIIKQLRGLGLIRIKFQGGEPTLRKDFFELSAYAQELGVITAVTTNGLQISKNPMLLNHLEEVVVSLDSPYEKHHDRYRGDGSYHHAVRALEHAKQTKTKTLVNMTVNKETFGDLEDMLRFCKERGYFLNAQPMCIGKIFYNADVDYLALPLEKIKEMNLRLANWKQKGEPVMFSPQSYKHAAAWDDYLGHNRIGDKPSDCVAGHEYFHIEPNGDVFPCSFNVGKFDPVNSECHGLLNAMEHATTHTCQDCWVPYLNERKALSSFRPGAIRAFLDRNRA